MWKTGRFVWFGGLTSGLNGSMPVRLQNGSLRWTEPESWPVGGSTGRTGRSGPIFKTLFTPLLSLSLSLSLSLIYWVHNWMTKFSINWDIFIEVLKALFDSTKNSFIVFRLLFFFLASFMKYKENKYVMHFQ